MSGQRYSVTIDVGANINQVKSAAAEMLKIFSSMNLDTKNASGITRLFNNLDKALSELLLKSNTALTGITDSRLVEKSVEKVNGVLNSLMQEFLLLGQNAPKELALAISGFSEKMSLAALKQNEYNKSIKETRALAKKLSEAETKAAEKVTAAEKARNDSIEKQKLLKGSIRGYKGLITKRNNDEIRKNYLEQILRNLEEINKIALKANARTTKVGLINEGDIKKLSPEDLENYRLLADILKKAQEGLEGYDKLTSDISKTVKSKLAELEKLNSTLKELETNLQNALTDWEKAQQAVKDFNLAGKESEAFNKLKENLTKVFNEESIKDVKNIEELDNALKLLADTAGGDVSSKIEKIRELLSSTDTPMKDTGRVIRETTEEFLRLGETNEELDHLTYRLKYFFSLAGGFNLMRRAIRSAVTTTKELDAVMTQTAVVSEYTVGDMWKTLPKYSKEAKKLGTAIKDVYGAQTLYVQLGLDMNSAMDLGVETLKMARVAGIGAEEATNSMTAALRGFNMELTETSAKRVNDVYSKLAQNTASNTQEISTAMTKTAALANSANMSFENTAAFLATIIESTREGAETAGTALKTVIARFSEVKKLYDENELMGTDEEGQEIDVNKISVALRTAGINMNEFFTGAKGLDEIFKELGSKWDSLTTVQLRYIATLAAGSRQQSRFLALMQNYSRTVELTNMAYNSAGSGQELFEKTLDSLEAKINQFKDTWDTLIMGIANSDMIKGFIDFGTQILEVFNNIIEALSGGNGVIKSISSLALAFGTFKLGRGIFGKNGILGALISKDPSKLGSNFGKTFIGGFLKSITLQVLGGQAGAVKQYLGGYFYLNFKPIKYDLEKIKILNAYEEYNLKLKEDENLEKELYGNVLHLPNLLYRDNLRKEFDKKTGLTKELGDKVIQDGGIKTYTVDYNALGNAAMLAGTAVYGVTAALEANGKVGEKTAGVIKGIATSLIAMGGAMKIVTALGEAFGFTTSLAGPIGLAIGATALIASVYDALNESEKERTERYKKEKEESTEYLNDLKNKYKDLEDSIDSLADKEDAFKGLIKGTLEWDEAVKDLNTSVLTLVEKYPELVQALEYNENGTLTLNKDTVKDVLKQYKEDILDATYRNVAAKNLINYLNFKSLQYANIERAGDFAGLNILSADKESSKKVKQAILEGINAGLLTELSSFSQADVDNKKSEGYQKLNTLLSDYLIKLGITDFSLDSALLKGAIAQETNRQAKKEYDKKLLADSFEKRQEIIEDTFVAEAGAMKQLALKGTEKAYSKAYENFNIEDVSKERLELYKEDFAKTHGGTYTAGSYDKYYEDSEGKKQEIKEDELNSFIATKKAFEAVENASDATQEWFSKLTKNVKDFVNGVGKRSDLDNEEIKKAFSDLDDGLFDYNDVKNKWQLSYNEIDENVSKALEGVFKDQLDEIDKEIEDTRKQKGSGISDRVKALEAKRLGAATGGLSELDLGVSDYDKIALLIVNASNNYGNKVAGSLANAIVSGINGLTFANQEDKNKFASALYEVNWKTIKSTDDLVLALNELGVAVNPTADGFETLAKSLLETQKALKTLSLKDLQKEAKERLDLRDSLKTATNATFSEEDYQKLLGYGAKRSDFVYTGLGYTYTSGQVKDLATTIDNNLGSIVEDTKKNLLLQIDIGKNFEKSVLASTDNSEDFGKFLSGELDKDDADTIRNIFSDLGIKELYNELTGETVKLNEITTSEGLVDYYKKYLDYYANYKSRELLIADIDKNAPFLGLTADYVRLNGGDALLQIAAAMVDAEKAGLDINNLTEYALQLNETYKIELAMAYAIAYDNMVMNQGILLLASSYDAWEKVLNAALEDEKIRGTLEYIDTVTGLRETLLKITGTTTKFSEEFLTATDTLKLFKEAAKGDINAINSLRKNAAKDIINVDSLGAAGLQLGNWIDNLDLDNIKIGAELDTNVADVFLGLLDAGAMTADLVNLALETIGYEPDVGTETVTVGSGTLTHQDGYTTFTDVNGVTHTVKNEGGMDIAANLQIEVPIIGGSSKSKAMGSSRGAAKFKGGAGSSVNPSSRKGGGGGGGGGKEFKNDFDKYYNQVEDINELIRIRNLLESDYNQLLKAEGSSGADIYENLKKLLGLLEERRKLTADLADKRKQQLFETMQDEEYKDVAKYATWNNEDLTIEIDWEAINKVKDSEEGNLIKEYVKKLEDFQSKYDELIEALEEIEDAVQEIKERGKEEYTSLEDRVRDALIKLIQDKIDELQDVNEAINDTNQKLFDSISETLELLRQERDNAKTEEELTDKEKRLAYLQQDSSNANQVEIAKLQEELADARESYTDTLIDLKISELQRQNDEAQELRAQLIELMQHSLDWQEKNGEFWNLVYALINEGIGPDGSLVNNSSLATILKTSENWAGLSAEGKMQWLADLQKDVKSAVSYLAMTRLLEDIGTKEGTKVTFTNGNELVLTGTVDKNGNVVVKNDDGSTTTYKNVFLDYSGAYLTFETNGEYKAAQKPITTTTTTTKPAATSENGSKGNNKVPDNEGWHTNETLHWHEYTDGSKYDEGNHDFMTVSTSMARGELCKVCGYLKNWSDIGHYGTYTGAPSEDNRKKKDLNDKTATPAGSTSSDSLLTSKKLPDLDKPSVYESSTSSTKKLPPIPKGLGKVVDERALDPTGVWSKDNLTNILKDWGIVEEKTKPTITSSGGGGLPESTYEELSLTIKRKGGIFAAGGLADFTGPAWLDGTRSNPELVLNSRDTQNFIELKDTLADMRKNGNLSLAGGNSYYEIVVNVDLMSSDYDVDKAIDRIKARLAQDGAYRNVNTLSRLR